MKSLPFSLYEPTERFVKLADSPLAKSMWHCVTSDENIEKMEIAIAKGDSPVLPLEDELHEKFHIEIEESDAESSELRILCMNMMKQVLEHLGYSHKACTLLPGGKFVTSAGLFEHPHK